MMRVIRKTRNGWLITTETSYMNNEDIAGCHVFESMRSLAAHLVKLAGESTAKRDAKGHFCRCKKKVAM